jgi:hypothetical protein
MMKTDKSLYLVSSQSAVPGRATGGSRSHLRLVPAGAGFDEDAPLVRSEAQRRMSAGPQLHVQPAAPLAPRSLSRPFAQRMMQLATDVAVFAVALIVGLRPNA